MPSMPVQSQRSRRGTRRRELVSYVLPVFNEQETLKVFHSSLTDEVAKRSQYDFEFIYVNDGSRDRSFEVLMSIQAQDQRVRVLDLSRNFGHQMAVSAGLEYAAGDAAIIMDTDLQDPPAVSIELVDVWREGFDVVYAQRRTRKDRLSKRVTASIYYRVLRKLADTEIPRDVGDFRLINRSVIDAIASMHEHHRFLRGMVSFVGFRQTAVPFDRGERFAGTTGYPLRKMLSFAADGLMGFSTVPLRMITHVGFFFAAASFLGILYVTVRKLLAPETLVQGWSLTIIALLFIGGIELIMMGVLGSYVARIYSEVQGRPLYLVRSVHGIPAEVTSRGAKRGKASDSASPGV